MKHMSPDPNSTQSEIIKSLHTRPLIDPAKEVEQRVDFLVNYLETTGAAGYVLGISGGQDSTLAGRLAQLACEQVDGAAFWACLLYTSPSPRDKRQSRMPSSA